jgi:hypothetical protein
MIKTYYLDQNSINSFFFIKRYINKKIINYILVDDDLTINILHLNIRKELGIHIYIYIYKTMTQTKVDSS